MNLTIEVRTKPEKYHELYQTLQALLPSLRSTTDCTDSRIYQDVENGEIFFLEIHCPDQGKLGNLMLSMAGSALLGALDLLSTSVRVRTGLDSSWDEIEVLKQMRKKAIPTP